MSDTISLNVRPASAAPFPYGWPGYVCYAVLNGENLVQIRGRDEMRKAVREALAGNAHILAAWPGEYRTDMFLIDEPQRLADAIGVKS